MPRKGQPWGPSPDADQMPDIYDRISDLIDLDDVRSKDDLIDQINAISDDRLKGAFPADSTRKGLKALADRFIEDVPAVGDKVKENIARDATIRDILASPEPLTKDDIRTLAKDRNIPEDRLLKEDIVRRELRQDARVIARGKHIEARRERFRQLERDDPGFVRSLLERRRDKAKYLQKFYELEQREAEQAADRFS